MKKTCSLPNLNQAMVITTKTLRVMRLTAFLLLAACLQAGAEGNAQSISISQSNTTLEKVFKEIHRKTGFQFFYQDELLKQAKKISINVKNVSVEQLLELCFKDQPLSFTITEKTITIRKKDETSAGANAQPPSALINITGKVKDEKGKPLAGVSVSIAGRQGGVTTDDDGNFAINVPENAVLSFSYVGYKTVTISSKGKTNIDITLVLEVSSLSDVVVTGVGVATSKRKLAFAVESVNADKLPPSSTASIDQALVGKIPGAQISSINGTPGSGVNILLRGINSVNGGTSPMILLDGIQVAATDLNSLDLSTIEKVEVVQGAASATIYGAQGANGVIQLFTKKGSKSGKVNIDVSSSYANSSYLNIGGLRKAQLHGYSTDAQNNVVDGDGNPLVFSPVAGYENNLEWNSLDPTNQTNKPYNANLKYYDHYKMFFKDAPAYNNAITISGGRDKFDVAFTISNNHQESNLKNNGYLNRTNLTTNIGIELAKNLRFRSVTQMVYTKNTMNADNVISQINMSRPFADYDFKDADGNHLIYFGNSVGNIGGNAFYDQQYRRINNKKTDILQTVNLNYKPNRFLELDAKYGINYQKADYKFSFLDQQNNQSAQYYGFWLASQNGNDASGEYYKSIGTTTFQNLIGTATIHLDFQKDFNLNIPLLSTTQAGYDYRKNNYNSFDVSGIGLPSYTPYTGADASSYRVLADYTTLFTTYGYLVTQRFDYGEYAGVSAGVRSDYSSAFGAGSKPFTFPRGDAYLRLSSLNFWTNGSLGKVLPELKIRAAYGKAGIQPGPYDRYITLNPTPLAGNIVFTTQTFSTNPRLDVEVSSELEIGTDMTFKMLKNNWLKRLDFSVTYWKRTTDNSIWPLDVAPSTGQGGVLNNSFGLKSNGWQASLNLAVLANKNFTWNFTTNFSKQSSEITSVKNGEDIPVDASTGSAGYILKPGYKIGQLFGYFALHDVNATDPTTGQPYIPKADQAAYEVASNGWVVNSATKVPYFTPNQYNFGDPNPKFNMSFINDVTYKDFINLSVQWDWVNGSHLYNQTKEWMYRDGIHGDLEKPITINGETGAWSAFYRGAYAEVERNGTKSLFYENSSFMRLRNLVVAVDLAKALHIKSLRKLQLVLTGRNLITITKYTGMDPEISSGPVNSSFDRGVDSHTMPNLRTYQAGINIGF